MLTITPNATTKNRIPLDFHILEKKVDLCFTSLHPVYNLSSPSCSQMLAGCFGVGVLPRDVKSSPSAPRGPDLECKAPCIVAASFSGPPGTPVMWGLMGRRAGLLLPPPHRLPPVQRPSWPPSQVSVTSWSGHSASGKLAAGYFSGLFGTQLPGQREVIYANAGTQC